MSDIEFKYEIKQQIKDKNRDLKIINREIRHKLVLDKRGNYTANQKWYLYKCNGCGREKWTIENNLYKGHGCKICRNTHEYKKPTLGLNSVIDTNPELIKYFKNPNEAKEYTYCSSKMIIVKCPDCGFEKDIKIELLCRYGFKCICSDGKPYAEKLTVSIFNQLGLKFKIEYVPKWDGLNGKRYDFHFKHNNEDYIVETHGEQHYRQQGRKGARTLEEEQTNDRIKKQLALDNGIKEENYIVINCLHSNIEWIKNNNEGIFKSKLSSIFNLNEINWDKAGDFALSNLIKEVCSIKKDNTNLTCSEIGNLVGLDRQTVRKYLKQGNEVGWCNYNPKEEYSKYVNRNATSIEIFKNDISLGVFPSAGYIEKQSEELFGVKLGRGMILDVCKEKYKQHKGFVFKFTNK